MAEARTPMDGLARAEERTAWLFLAPSVVLYLMFTGIPVLAVLVLSFTKWDLFTTIDFVGFANYLALARDAIFQKVLTNTGLFVLASVPAQVILGLVFALGLNRSIPGRTGLRVAYFLPVVTSTVAAALVWAFLFNSNYGLINAALSAIGVTELPKWLASTRWSLWAVIIVFTWQNLGYAVVLFLAGLQNIRQDIFDAATLDGSSGWTSFWNLTLPLLSPTTFFVVVIALINSFQVFELVFVMTQAGPANATNTLVYYIYQNGFAFYQMGYASAAAMVLFVIVLAVTLVQYKLQDRWVHYD
jgi:multiple sugar transport system permease protein